MKHLYYLSFSVALICCSPGGESHGPSDPTAPTQLPSAATVSVGPDGGVLRVRGLTLEIPVGALPSAIDISIEAIDSRPPQGVRALTSVYRFAPDGLNFEAPATATFDELSSRPNPGSLFLSNHSTGGWEALAGHFADDRFVTSLSHFSEGFVGDVIYTEPTDLTCVRLSPLAMRRFESSALGLFFSAETCAGEPIGSLTSSDFVVTEDGRPLSEEASVFILPNRAREAFVTLLVDQSTSAATHADQVRTSARGFVDRLALTAPGRVHLGIAAFDGSEHIDSRLNFTLDLEQARSAIDELYTESSTDPNSTNLYGALIEAANRSRTAQSAFESRNQKGVFSTGLVVVFSDGADTAGYRSSNDVQAVRDSTGVQLLAIELNSPDAQFSQLEEIANDGYFRADTTTDLESRFDEAAARVAGRIRSAYLLGYCSPQRSGEHTVSISVAREGTATEDVASFDLDADGFGPGCSDVAFDCEGIQCGGAGCGACDDREAACAPRTLECISFCATAALCDGSTFQNPNGYSQVCSSTRTNFACEGECVNLDTDPANCGACGNICNNGICNDGACNCEPGYSDCNISAVDGCESELSSSAHHCGTCEVDCGPNTECVAGVCGCAPGWHDCLSSLDGCETKELNIEVPADGACACAVGYGDCDGDPSTGCEAAQVHLSVFGPGLCECASGYENRNQTLTDGCECRPLALLSSPGSNACAVVAADHQAWCWGPNFHHGVLFDEGQVVNRPTLVNSLPSATSLAVGEFHTCALTLDGGVYCWGWNTQGSLGLGYSSQNELGPTLVPGLTSVNRLIAGGYRTCALTTNDDLFCWGGRGASVSSSTPQSMTSSNIPVFIEGAVKDAGTSGHHACFVGEDGRVRCLGANDVGQCGIVGTSPRTSPILVNGLPSAVAQVAITGQSPDAAFSCALSESGEVWCWGTNSSRQLGSAVSSSYSYTPVKIEGLPPARAISAGGWASGGHVCALLLTDELMCWGENGSGQLGIGPAIASNGVYTVATPSLVHGDIRFASISCGNSRTCGISSGGNAYCWGTGGSGGLGLGPELKDHNEPALIVWP